MTCTRQRTTIRLTLRGTVEGVFYLEPGKRLTRTLSMWKEAR